MECLQAMESCSTMKVQDAERPLLQGKLQGKYKQGKQAAKIEWSVVIYCNLLPVWLLFGQISNKYELRNEVFKKTR